MSMRVYINTLTEVNFNKNASPEEKSYNYVLDQYWLRIRKGQYKFPLSGWHLSFWYIGHNFLYGFLHIYW